MINHAVRWLVICCLLIVPFGQGRAQGRIALVRDAEIEATIRAYAEPLFKAGGLDASFVEVHLVQNDEINAFVAGGQRLFIHTGLLRRAKTANQVIGVIAHETGHIIGGHLARVHEALRRATIETVIATVLGVGAAVGGALAGSGGAANAGVGAISLGQNIALRNFLQYTQQQESSADQAGLSLLDATGQSSRGLLEFFQLLEGQEHLLPTNQDPYLRTHPLTRARISAVAEHVANSPYSDVKDTPEIAELHQRMIAKLVGYLRPLEEVLRTYPKTDQSIGARYARAVGYFRRAQMPNALAEMDSLLKELPQDPFFLEQKAQILYQNGRIKDAIPLYAKAAELRPGEGLLQLETGQALIESEDDSLLSQAIKHLESASRLESDNPSMWRWLAVAYGRSGNLPMAALAQAEQASARGDLREAKFQADKALKGLPVGSPASLRAEDILNTPEEENQ